MAARLNHLFETVHTAARGPGTCEEVADACAELGEPMITATQLRLLRSGHGESPSQLHLRTLAQHFGVPEGYFYDDLLAEQIDAELALLVVLRDTKATGVYLCTRGMDQPFSANHLRWAAAIVEFAARPGGSESPTSV